MLSGSPIQSTLTLAAFPANEVPEQKQQRERDG